MAFIIFFLLLSLKKFEKVEKTGCFRAKFLLRCTLSLILGAEVIKGVASDKTNVSNLGLRYITQTTGSMKYS